MPTISTLGSLSSNNGLVEIHDIQSAGDARHVYSVVHEAIMDSYIPIAKPIGFKISNGAGSDSGILKSMHVYSVETLPEVMSNISKLIIKDWDTDDSHMSIANLYKIPLRVKLPTSGSSKVNVWESKFKAPIIINEDSTCKYPGNDGNEFHFLNTNQYLFTSLKSGAVLELCVYRSTGYLTMESTYSRRWETAPENILGVTEFVDTDSMCYMNVDFSLRDFVRIKPLDVLHDYNSNTKVLTLPLTFCKGFTAHDFDKLWQRMINDKSDRSYTWLMRKLGGKEI